MAFKNKCIYLCINFWPWWVSVAVLGGRGCFLAGCRRLLLRVRALDSRPRPLLCVGSAGVAHGLSLPKPCGVISDQGANLCPLRWQGNSYPVDLSGLEQAMSSQACTIHNVQRSLSALKLLCAAPTHPFLPGPLATTDFFPVSIVLPFPDVPDSLLSLTDDFSFTAAVTTLVRLGAQCRGSGPHACAGPRGPQGRDA